MLSKSIKNGTTWYGTIEKFKVDVTDDGNVKVTRVSKNIFQRLYTYITGNKWSSRHTDIFNIFKEAHNVQEIGKAVYTAVDSLNADLKARVTKLHISDIVDRIGRCFDEQQEDVKIEIEEVEESQLELTELQKTVANKMSATTIIVLTSVLKTITQSYAMSPQAFVDTYVAQVEEKIASLDQRTANFFNKMIVAVDEQLSKIPHLKQPFAMLALEVKDPDVAEKFVKSIALQPIVDLMKDLDRLKPSVVDDIIQG